MISKVWLADIPWEMVAWQNEQLCKAKNAHHGPTSDGYDVCRALWQESQMQEVPLVEIVDCAENVTVWYLSPITTATHLPQS